MTALSVCSIKELAMNKRFIIPPLFCLLISSLAFGQEPDKQEPKTRNPRQPQKQPVVEMPAEQQPAQESTDDAMRKVLTALSEQVGKLAVEIRKTRLDSER